MRRSRSTLTPFDPEIERIARSIRRAVREANIAQIILVEYNLLISSNTEEGITMVVIPPPTMGDYCKRTDEGWVSIGFVPTYPANFDIKNYVLLGLRDNLFKRNTIRDSWEHLAHFYKTASMCRPAEVTEDQVKQSLFGFLLIGGSKDWLLCLTNGTIRTWKEMEDKFLERSSPPLSLLSEEQKLQILSSRKLNRCMTHGKGLNFYYSCSQIIT